MSIFIFNFNKKRILIKLKIFFEERLHPQKHFLPLQSQSQTAKEKRGERESDWFCSLT
jgi:hypothetical protein